MHILFIEYFALSEIETLPTIKSIRLSSCYSPRLDRINRLTELNSNNSMSADVNTEAHFTTIAHDTIVSPSLYSQVPLIQEQEHYHDFPSHRALMDTISWTSASTGNTLVYTDLMNSFLSVTAATAIGKKLANFAYFTAEIKMTVVVQGFSNNYGKMIMWFDPTPYQTDQGSTSVNVPAAGTLPSVPQKVRSEHVPHIEIDPSLDTTYELTLKCDTAIGCWSHFQRTGSYRYGYIIYNPLNNGLATTVPTVTIQVFMSLENVRLSTLTFTSSEVQSLDNIIFTSSFTSKEQNVKPSTALKSISTGLMQLSSIPYISKFATLGSNITGLSAAILNWFGFSKPVVTTKQNMMLAYTCDEISTLDGAVHAHTMAARHDNSITIDSSSIPFCSMQDQDIEYIANKLFLVKQFTVLPAATTLSAIGDLYLDSTTLFPTDSPAIANGYEPTALFWLTRMHRAYKCDFLIEVECVSSPVHRCTIGVAYFPNVVDTSSTVTFAAAAQTVKTSTIQVAGNSKTLFKIPYSQPFPYLIVNSGFNTTSTSEKGYSNGRLAFYLVNPVVSNGTGPVYINVRMGVCNLKLGVPNTAQIQTLDVVLTSTPEDVTEAVCIPDPNFYKKFFGEDMAHTTKELASRATVTSYYEDTLFSTSIYCYELSHPTQPLPAATVGTLNRVGSMLDWISIAYVGYKGSTNLTWFPNISNGGAVIRGTRNGFTLDTLPGVGFFVKMVDFFALGTSSEYAFATTFGRNQNFITTKHPYYYKGHFRPIFPVYSGTGTASVNGTCAVQNEVLSTSTFPWTAAVASALGDDGQFVGFRGFPVVVP